ncbi:MAG: hypothetical protein GEU97_00525 [Actinophytocola sp.]|nr:hypothetical protein [Actinophytocola sp.]
MTTAVLLLLAVPLVGIAIAHAVLHLMALVSSTRESQRTLLASECFSGLPTVVVAPQQWSLSPYDIRMMAARRGYQEAPPPAPHLLAFRHAPAAVRQPVHRGDDQAPARVAAELTSRGFAWLTPSEIGGTVADVTALAAHHGAQILRQYGDHLNPLLLVSTWQVGSLVELVPETDRAPLRSRTRILTRGGINLGATVATAVIITVGLMASSGMWIILTMVPVLYLADLTVFLLFSARDSTTERTTRLLREFDGRSKIPIVKRHYRLDRLAILDVAAEFGYEYSKFWNHRRPTTRWYEECLVFEPRAAVPHP